MAIFDENFLCGCGGVLAPLEQQRDEFIRYVCATCGRTGPIECPLCHNPRTIWMEYGKKCLFCGKGKVHLTRIFETLIGAV